MKAPTWLLVKDRGGRAPAQLPPALLLRNVAVMNQAQRAWVQALAEAGPKLLVMFANGSSAVVDGPERREPSPAELLEVVRSEQQRLIAEVVEGFWAYVVPDTTPTEDQRRRLTDWVEILLTAHEQAVGSGK